MENLFKNRPWSATFIFSIGGGIFLFFSNVPFNLWYFIWLVPSVFIILGYFCSRFQILVAALLLSVIGSLSLLKVIWSPVLIGMISLYWTILYLIILYIIRYFSRKLSPLLLVLILPCLTRSIRKWTLLFWIGMVCRSRQRQSLGLESTSSSGAMLGVRVHPRWLVLVAMASSFNTHLLLTMEKISCIYPVQLGLGKEIQAPLSLPADLIAFSSGSNGRTLIPRPLPLYRALAPRAHTVLTRPAPFKMGSKTRRVIPLFPVVWTPSPS